jgi:hypothetical protein
MTRTLGAAVGAVIVILFLVTVASRLSASAPVATPSADEAQRDR